MYSILPGKIWLLREITLVKKILDILRCEDYPELIKRFLNEEIITDSNVHVEKRYLHQDFQNELLNIMAQHVSRNLLCNISESRVFSIMCGEFTEISNKEQQSFCIGWVDKQLQVHEDFIGFYELTAIKNDTVVSVIKDILIRLQLSLSNCRGETYDGASNMLGRKSGAATQISNIQPKALVNHCYGHSLSFTVKDVTSNYKILNDVVSNVEKIAILVKSSPKREKILGSIKDNIEQKDSEMDYLSHVEGLSKLPATRWTVRADSFRKVIKNYLLFHDLWDSCLQNSLQADMKASVIGCKTQMNFSLDCSFLTDCIL